MLAIMGPWLMLAGPGAALGEPATEEPAIDTRAAALETRLVQWRRELHQHPELSNREYRTAAMIAIHLRELGMEIRTNVAHTGVIGILNAGKSGPLVALRADMDGLPVTEQTGLPFASTETAEYDGQETGVMHACGHDAHMAILMATAQVLAGVKDELPGSVMFIFQPAEEGAPPGEEGGARLMIEEGIFAERTPDAIFGLHVGSMAHTGVIRYRAGPFMAAEDRLAIRVTGRQAHGAKPWEGVDPVVVSAQIVLGLQTIASRQVNMLSVPSVISIGSIHGGIRSNIIPETVEMVGTIRTFDEEIRSDIHRRIGITAEAIARSAGARAEVEITEGYPVLINDPDLVGMMAPTLERVAGPGRARAVEVITWAEDFAYYAREAPALFFHLGVTPPDADLETAAPNHSPFFTIDEDALLVGVRALSHLTIDFMAAATAQAVPEAIDEATDGAIDSGSVAIEPRGRVLP
jgi:amidohydrolase